jgi:hypothetical protein
VIVTLGSRGDTSRLLDCRFRGSCHRQGFAVDRILTLQHADECRHILHFQLRSGFAYSVNFCMSVTKGTVIYRHISRLRPTNVQLVPRFR